MNSAKLRYTCVAVLCLTALQARADDASKRAKVEQLFTVMKINQMTEQITAGIRRQMEASMRTLPGAAQMTPAQKKLLDDYESKTLSLVNQTVSWKAMEPQMVELYTTTYTEQEIDGILAFYKSPTGQTMLAKTPELTGKSMQITQSKLAALQPQVSAMAQEFSQKFAAAGAPPPASGVAPKTAPH